MLLRNRIATAAVAVGSAAALALAGASSASAHVSAQMYGSTATSGGYGFTFLRIPHGCGVDATNKITVQIPAGVTAVKPQAKAGWKVTKVKDANGNVTEVSWSNGMLPTDEFDDFGLSVKWPTLPEGVDMQKVYFPTIQECDADVLVSVGGKSARVSLAAGVTLAPNAKAGVFVDGVRVGSARVAADGSLSKAFPAAKVPASAVVELRIGGSVVASNQAGEQAWTQIPMEGHDAHALDYPAPSVTVMASSGTGGH